MPAPGGPPLILVATPLELGLLAELGGFPGFRTPQVCGFGPVSAAARTAALLAEHGPGSLCLIGLAGGFGPDGLGSARVFDRIHLDGVGVGTGRDFVPASRIGFAQSEGGGEERIAETLELEPAHGTDPAELLTVCAASASPAEAEARRVRYPRALAEDMESFGVALACRLRATRLLVVRGLSNRAGERDPSRWL